MVSTVQRGMDQIWGQKHNFIMLTPVRKFRNKIETLKDEKGEWITDQTRMEDLIQKYFLSIFS